MSVRTESLERRRPRPTGEVPEPAPPPKLARGSSRVVTAEVMTPPARIARSDSPRDLTMRATGRRDPTLLSAAILAAYLGQAIAGLEVPWLAALQQVEVYKLASGTLLVVFIALQWLLARRSRDVHVWLGAAAPLVLYAHASRFAYGYLVWLVVVYLGVGAVGLWHRPIIARRARRLYVAWFVAHLALSVLLLVLAAYHIVIAVAYE